MATPIIVCGAAGRMGRTLVTLVTQTEGACLVGAVEVANHPAIGRDAGEVAAVGTLGVPITDDFEALAEPSAVALDFTNAAAAIDHLRSTVRRQSGIVIGSTGYSAAEQSELDRLAPQTRSVVSSNMSVGVTVLQQLVRHAARVLGPDFDPEIVEMHHRMKVDAPSGTALMLARTLADATSRDFAETAVYGREGIIGPRPNRELAVLALRGGDVVGDHTIIFAGMGERLELTHRAQSRDCLARGALRAALWLADQPVGRYSMAEVLGL